MKLISHRGNIDGVDKHKENNPLHVLHILKLGYDCEIDLRMCNNQLYLGHDKAEYYIEKDYIFNNGLWLHCKDFDALQFCLQYKNVINFFYHTTEDYIVTSLGYIWTFPDCKNKLGKKSIAVLPEKVDTWDVQNCYGICSDDVKKYEVFLK